MKKLGISIAMLSLLLGACVILNNATPEKISTISGKFHPNSLQRKTSTEIFFQNFLAKNERVDAGLLENGKQFSFLFSGNDLLFTSYSIQFDVSHMLTINGKQLQYHNAFEINLQKNPMIIQGIYDIQHTIPRLIFITDELTHPLIEIHITPQKEVPTFEQAKGGFFYQDERGGMCNYKPGSGITFIKKEKKIQGIQNTFIFLNAERTQGRRCLEVNSNQYIIMMGNRDTNIMPSEHELEKIFTIM